MARNTQQRRAIIKVMENASGPLSIEEIYGLANQFCKGIGIATVYRNLKAFMDEGMLKSIDMPGGLILYEMTEKEHHHHFSCLNCKKVFDVDVCIVKFDKLIPKGFRLHQHEIHLAGLCSKCSITESKMLVSLQ